MFRASMKSAAALALSLASALADGPPAPLMRDLIGLNTHTVQHKPDLYAPVARVLRDYHPVKWDFGDKNDSSMKLDFPFAKNRVDWNHVYGSWKKAGYRSHASLLFDDMKPEKWKDLPSDAHRYGLEFARAFGPSSERALLEAAEIGNEPGKYDDATYRMLFENMARGLRAGDPKLRIATCAMTLGKSHDYAKSVECIKGLDSQWDILNIHIYAEVEPWPTWKRSYPEDPAAKWLDTLTKIIAWRDANAKGKPIWVTEFGYDASTKTEGKNEFKKWQGSTEEQQAMWNVRSYLLCARHGVERAHVFFFDDKDEPQVHGSSGLTRNFVPKPAFHAQAWLLRSLGDYRFTRVEREDPAECFAYEFTHGTDPKKKVWAIWKPAGPPKVARLFHDPMEIRKAERMPLSADAPEAAEVKKEIEGYFAIEAGEKPVFVWLQSK
jgi:hypothetical protein